MKPSIVINGIEIHHGEHKELNLNTYRLPSRTDIHVPVHIYRAEQDGPVVLLTAGMHGDEVNGVETIRQLIRGRYFERLKHGSVVVIPIVNIVSFLAGSRELPDGKDLNRCFPGTKGGSLGSRIAYDMVNKILPQIDMGIDFHTGGHKINNYPQVRCVFNDPKSIKMAKLFEPPFIINSSYREGSFRKEAASMGKPILVYEGGESSRFNKLAITEGVHGCLRLMNKLNMLDVHVGHGKTIILNDNKWVRAKASGLFRTTKKYGSFFEKDQIMGTISDPYGEKEIDLRAPADGFIIGINNQPVINEGDALIHVGVE